MSTGVAAQTRVPRVVAVLALSIFVLGTSEFMITGLLPEMARDLAVSIPATGYLISAFAIGMIVGAPLMAVVTLAMPRRTTLVASLVVFVAGHVLAALASDYAVVLVARVLTALATATFWVVAAVVAVSTVGEHLRARALAVLLSGLTIATVLGIPLGTVVGQQLAGGPRSGRSRGSRCSGSSACSRRCPAVRGAPLARRCATSCSRSGGDGSGSPSAPPRSTRRAP